MYSHLKHTRNIILKKNYHKVGQNVNFKEYQRIRIIKATFLYCNGIILEIWNGIWEVKEAIYLEICKNTFPNNVQLKEEESKWQ